MPRALAAQRAGTSLGQAVGSFFRRHEGSSGRARRSEPWWATLFMVVVSAVAGILDAATGDDAAADGTGPVLGLVSLALLLPSLAMAARRLHDTDRSAWWVLLGAPGSRG